MPAPELCPTQNPTTRRTASKPTLVSQLGAKATTEIRRFDVDKSGIVSSAERWRALEAWRADYDATAESFHRMTGQAYRLPPGQMPSSHMRLRAGSAFAVTSKPTASSTARTNTKRVLDVPHEESKSKRSPLCTRNNSNKN